MRPTCPQGAGYLDLEIQTTSTQTEQTAAAERIGRAIDWCLGLEIDYADKDITLLARRDLVDDEFSLDQSISYFRSYSLVDFEIKKVSDRDLLVRLAIMGGTHPCQCPGLRLMAITGNAIWFLN